MPPLANAVIPSDLLFDFSGAPSFAPQHRQRSSGKSAKGGSCIFRVVEKAKRPGAIERRAFLVSVRSVAVLIYWE